MRYIVYLLVVANLALVTWYWFSPSPQPDFNYPLATPPGIDRLVLLSERNDTEALPASSAASTDNASEQQVAPSEAGDATPEPETDASSGNEPQVPASESANTPAVAPQQVCQTVGPFLEKKDVTSVFKSLAMQGYVLNIRDGDVREPDGYWVYLPAMSASRAREIVADLDAHGMKDYFIGKQNHISLGIFSDADKARARQQTVKTLGYTPILDQRYRMRDVFWLDIEQAREPLLGSSLWEKILAEHTDIRVQRISCE